MLPISEENVGAALVPPRVLCSPRSDLLRADDAGAGQDRRFCESRTTFAPVRRANLGSDVRTCSPATTCPPTRSAGGQVVRRSGVNRQPAKGRNIVGPSREIADYGVVFR